MYKFIKNKYIRNFVIVFNLISCFSYRSIPVKAITGVEETVVIGGIEVSTVAVSLLVGTTLVAGGSYLYENVDSQDLKYIAQGMVNAGEATKNFAVRVDEKGRQFLSWSADGIKNFVTTLSSIISDGIKDFIEIGIRYDAGQIKSSDGFYDACDISLAPGYSVVCGWSGFVSGQASYSNEDTSYHRVKIRVSSDYKDIYVDGNLFSHSFKYDGYSNPGYRVSKINSSSTDYDNYVYNPAQQGVKGFNESVCVDNLKVDSLDNLYNQTGFGVPLTSTGAIDTDVTGGVTVPYGQSWSQDVSNPYIYTPSKTVEGDIDVPAAGEGTIGATGTGSWVLNIPILGDILKALLNILELLKNFISSLLSGLLDLLKTICIPSDTYFNDNFNGLKNDIIGKLGYKQYIDIFGDSSEEVLKDITMNWNGHTVVVVKMTTFEKFRNLFNSFCYGFMFFGLAIFNYNQIYKIFRNNNYAKMVQTIGRARGE